MGFRRPGMVAVGAALVRLAEGAGWGILLRCTGRKLGIQRFRRAERTGLQRLKRKLAENLRRVQHRIEEACQRADRDPSSVTLVAVTKYASLDVIRAMVDLGYNDLGESRVQELTKRAAAINEWLGRRPRELNAGARPRPRWHMVGHLQRNKVKAVLPWVDMIHSLDSLRLAEEIDAQASKLGRKIPVLLEVNAADEPGKFGMAVAAVTHLAEQIHSLEHIDVRGLMAMAPLTGDEQRIRFVFNRARELFDEVVGQRICGPQFKELSMGMSNDFEWGIEAGATHVRIGTALVTGIELTADAVQAE